MGEEEKEEHDDEENEKFASLDLIGNIVGKKERHMLFNYRREKAANGRNMSSSLCVRPMDVGDTVVFHPPFRCFGGLRSKLSNVWVWMTIHDKGGDD
ncbi:hypothetical protein ACPVTF_02015 [Geobacillus icigianus]|uniref:Uncharacterized protein n=1 Tax=Geobacillus subterraneus TaxID=129338 RepID=A0A679FPK0_9BACL|nr:MULTISPECIES: hypothetical protein [Geobacillus]KYD25535.1 hypothetical protein B4113_1645 [Geobacillus sp. B4113_201601]BBW98408.1 hypothetical protein GsuE55_32410 [Geobacillus subterraneus]